MRRASAAVLALAAQACTGSPLSTAPPGSAPSPPVLLPPPSPFDVPAPAAVPSDLTFDVRFRTAIARGQLGGGALVDVEDGVFVLIAAAGTRAFDPGVALVRQALPALFHDRFSRHPTRAVTLYLFEDPVLYESACATQFGMRRCPSDYGFYQSWTREAASDQHYGSPSILHELVHVLTADDYPRAPRWLQEGLSALYELPDISGTAIHGKTNGRLDALLAAMRSPSLRDLTTLDGVFSTPEYLFDAETHPVEAPVVNAAARFFCQWLDSAGQDHLWKFYRTWRDHWSEDKTGEKSFAAVVGQTPSEANAAWERWVRGAVR